MRVFGQQFRIGNTPLVHLQRLGKDLNAKIFAKVEGPLRGIR